VFPAEKPAEARSATAGGTDPAPGLATGSVVSTPPSKTATAVTTAALAPIRNLFVIFPRRPGARPAEASLTPVPSAS
jgi:hypothetical protein